MFVQEPIDEQLPTKEDELREAEEIRQAIELIESKLDQAALLTF